MKFKLITNGCEPTLGNVDTLRQILVNKFSLFEVVTEPPDIVVIFPCTFNQEKRNDSDTLIDLTVQDYSESKLILITGCFLDKQFEKVKNVKYSKYNDLASEVETFLLNYQYEKNDILYQRKVPFVEISRGCYGACSFCSIVSVKGKHTSYPSVIVLENITQLVEDGYHTIKLVGDEVAGYGMDSNSSLQELLAEIHCMFPNLKIELGQLNPNILKDWNLHQFEFLSDPRIVGSIFLPLQSASNSILKKMNRFYSVEEYRSIYNQIKKVRVKGEISTDIIIGFPTETDDDHQQNISFLKTHQFDFLGVFTFDKSDTKTKAGRMDGHLDTVTIQKRYDEIMNLISTEKSS
jgi:MiaB/RimO family radical SAM methylthiotransferase